MQSNKPRYLIIQELGSGTFGKVYKVTNGSTIFAMKVIKNPGELAIQELHILKFTNHPNIIRYVDSFMKNDGSLNIVMEFADQGALSTQTLCWPEKKILKFAAQIISALGYLQTNGIIHRDLKPGNILCVSAGNNQILLFKVADFGNAKRVNDVMQDNHYANIYAGTYCYMAPEVLNRLPYTSKADIWSLGAVMFYVCYGKHLFKDNGQVLELNGMIFPLSSNYSSYLQYLVARMLNVNTEQRPNALKLCFEAKQIIQFATQLNPIAQLLSPSG